MQSFSCGASSCRRQVPVAAARQSAPRQMSSFGLACQRLRRHRSAPQDPCTDAGGGTGPPRGPPKPPRATAEMPADGAPEGKKGGWGWKGWNDRVAADPAFVYKVCVEQIIGVGAAVLGDMSTRPNWGINELDFVFSTLIVGSLMNFALMYLLAPSAGAKGATASAKGLAKLFDERTLTSMGAPGGHIFEAGYSLAGRATNLAFKGAMFGVIGFSAGVVGTCMSNGLITVRKKLDPDFKSQNQTPNVLLNSLAWTMHMGISSNLRYQMLNGLDGVLVKKLSPALFKSVVVAIRTFNNVVGGMSFVTCARIVGSQKPAGTSDPPVVQAEERLERKAKKLKNKVA